MLLFLTTYGLPWLLQETLKTVRNQTLPAPQLQQLLWSLGLLCNDGRHLQAIAYQNNKLIIYIRWKIASARHTISAQSWLFDLLVLLCNFWSRSFETC